MDKLSVLCLESTLSKSYLSTSRQSSLIQKLGLIADSKLGALEHKGMGSAGCCKLIC